MGPAAPEAPAASTEPAAAPAKAAPSFNNQLAGGKQTVSAGGTFNPATMQNEPGAPAPAGGVPEKQANLNFNPKTGAAIPAGGATQDEIKAKQDARAASRTGGPTLASNKFDQETGEPIDLKTQIKNRLGKPDTNFKGYKAAAQAKGIQNASKSFAGKRKLAEAAIGSKVVDKAILIAAQDAAKMGIGALGGAAASAAPAGGSAAAPAQGGGEQGGVMAGLKKGMGSGSAAAAAPTVTYEQVKAMVDQLAVADKQHLLTDLQKEVATAPTESVKRKGSKLAESKQYYSLFRK